MKIRNGFVSNSSTSSYVCDICGEDRGGQDTSIDESDMKKCVNGHTTCFEHDSKQRLLEKYIEEKEEAAINNDDDDDYIFDYEETPSRFCPVCRLDFAVDKEMLQYLLRLRGKTREEISDEIKHDFKDYKEFSEFIGKECK